MGSWRLKKQVDFGEELVYKFTPKFVLKAGQSVTVRTHLSVCAPRYFVQLGVTGVLERDTLVSSGLVGAAPQESFQARVLRTRVLGRVCPAVAVTVLDVISCCRGGWMDGCVT